MFSFSVNWNRNHDQGHGRHCIEAAYSPVCRNIAMILPVGEQFLLRAGHIGATVSVLGLAGFGRGGETTPGNAGARRSAEFNHGHWDRLEGNAPFLEGFGPKPPGASCYPMARVAERGRDPTMGSAMDPTVRRFPFPAPAARHPGCR